ncbi:MAG: hypothetical protein U9R02_10555 [Thermodesulfobacteriota bacterium]|nr:hypothetical protein [Thermodesulfobacteriota bacterium]
MKNEDLTPMSFLEETGHKATDVARILGIKRVNVHHAAKKGEKVLENLPSPL